MSTSARSTDGVHVRPAGSYDAGGLAALLRLHGAKPTEGDLASELREWMAEPPALWHLAEIDGTILGLQRIAPPDPPSPPLVWRVATFVAPEGTMPRATSATELGSALWQATERAARRLRLTAIEARVPDGNGAALAYYRSRGFEDVPGRLGMRHLVHRL